MKHLLAFFLIAVQGYCAFAQQPLTSAMWERNQQWMNPAFTGRDSSSVVALNFRQQWLGFEAAPAMATAWGDGSFGRLGVGVLFQEERMGVWRRDAIGIQAAYHLPLGSGTFSAGMRASIEMISEPLTSLALVDGDDPEFTRGNENFWYINPGVGLSWSSERLKIFASAPRMMHTTASPAAEQWSAESELRLSAMPLSIGVGAVMIRKETVQWHVLAVALRELESNFYPLVATHAEFSGKMRLGLQYRHGRSAGAWVGLRIFRDLEMALAYESALTGVASPHTGEIQLRYTLKP
jgi:type IX secretion system PorP/SprF family membrane protein